MAKRRYTARFKFQVVLEVLRKQKEPGKVARAYGVRPITLGLWKKELQEQAASLFGVKRGAKPVEPSATPERLYSEIGRLKMELDWLKKKSGISL